MRQAPFGFAARQEQGAFDIGRRLRRRRRDEDLFDARHAASRDLAAGFDRHRHHAPTGDAQAFAAQRLLQGVARADRGGFVLRKKNHADGEIGARVDACLVGDGAQEGLGPTDQQAAAVAAATIGADGPAMREAPERDQGSRDQFAARAIIEVGDQPEAAAVAFECRGIEPPGRGSAHRPSGAGLVVTGTGRRCGGAYRLHRHTAR